MQSTAGMVSVVIPAYNAEKSLKRCIESVLDQTYEYIEIILVNDGSKDETETIAKNFGDRVRYIFQNNQGETAARNTGFALAQGEFVSFIDHDDYWHPEFIQKCVEFLNKHSESVAVSVGSEHKNALKKTTSIMPAYLMQIIDKQEKGFVIKNFFDFWAKHNHICAGSAVLRRSLIERAGGQRTDLVLSGDLEYWAYLATFGLWGFIP